MMIFLYLSQQRSYSKALFDDAISRMLKARIKTPSEIEHFRSIQERVEEIVKENNIAAEDFENAPDEFKGQSTYLCSLENGLRLAAKVCGETYSKKW